MEQELSTMTKEQISAGLANKEWRMENLYSIVDESGERIPFRLNLIQGLISEEASGFRDIILKYRQGGVSTYKIIDLVDDTIWGGRNRSNYFVTHRQDLLDEFFKKAKFTLDTIHESVRGMIFKPSTKNSNELYFSETNNTLRIGLDVRGRTPTNLHISEFGPMGMEKQKILFQQFDSFRKTRITIESTANGMGDVFHAMCMNANEGKGDFKLLFYGFDIDDRNESDVPEGFKLTQDEEIFMGNWLSKYPKWKALRKMVWRRKKIENANALGEKGDRKFSEENPISIEDAFISSGTSVFDMTLQYEAEHPIETIEGFDIFCEPEDELSIGVDVAEGGVKGDYSTISARRRNGKLAFQLKEKLNEELLAKKIDFILTQYSSKTRADPSGQNRFIGGILIENNVGLALINECKKYPWFQYVLKERKKDTSSEDNLVQKYGFRTTVTSKDMIIREYRGALYRKDITVSVKILAEMRTFQYDENNRPNAQYPNHDDLLMADMIAYHGLKHEPFVAKKRKAQPNDEGLTPYQKHIMQLKNGELGREEDE